MELPWVNEIRAARQLAERAHEARLVLEELLVLEKQRAVLARTSTREGADDPLADVLNRARRLLESSSTPPDLSSSDLEAVLAASREALRSLAAEQEKTAKTLHQLQHRQQHDLADPRYAEETKALRKVGDERAEIAEALPLVERQHAVLGPALSVLDGCLASLDGVASTDAETVRLVRVRTIEGSVQSVASVLDAAGIEHEIMQVISWSEEEPSTSEQVASAIEDLRRFGLRYRELADELSSRVRSLQTRDAELEAVLLRRLG